MEQTVSKEKTIVARMLYGFAWALVILFVLMGLYFAASVFAASEGGDLEIRWSSVIGCVLTLASALSIWRFKDGLHIEYDYVLSENRLEVTRIMNNRRRKQCLALDLGRIQECGVFRAQKPGVKLERLYLDPNADLSYICYEEKGERRMALLQLNEDMIASLKKSRALQRGVWRDAEGKSSNYAGLS